MPRCPSTRSVTETAPMPCWWKHFKCWSLITRNPDLTSCLTGSCHSWQRGGLASHFSFQRQRQWWHRHSGDLVRNFWQLWVDRWRTTFEYARGRWILVNIYCLSIVTYHTLCYTHCSIFQGKMSSTWSTQVNLSGFKWLGFPKSSWVKSAVPLSHGFQVTTRLSELWQH
jgi:hypothetical protein